MPNPYLPRETLDYIVDFIHDKPEALKECCLVSKSWVPRTRRHLFAHIEFHSAEDFKSWKKAFPDPSSSPAHHTHSLFVRHARVVMMADAEAGGLIRTFSRVVWLGLGLGFSDNKLTLSDLLEEISLVPFYNFSPILKSLRVDSILLPCSQIFNLVRSFPLLEDLTLTGYDELWDAENDPHGSQTIVPSDSPAFTGSLDLAGLGGVWDIVHRLLDLPSGLHFRRLNLLCYDDGDLRWIVKLVVACSNTLEYLDVAYEPDDESSRLAPIDLSKATKLKDIVFRCGSLNNEWVATTLETITPQHQDLQQISIHVPYASTPNVREGRSIAEWITGITITTGPQPLKLDRLLVQFWESRSIRPKVACPRAGEEGKEMKDWVGSLLPEAMERGILDLVEEPSGSQ